MSRGVKCGFATKIINLLLGSRNFLRHLKHVCAFFGLVNRCNSEWVIAKCLYDYDIWPVLL